jgi:type IV pilus assembly protein PilC
LATYYYTAKDRSGNTITGSIDADDERSAASRLREMGHFPMDVRSAHAQGVTYGRGAVAFIGYFVSPLCTGINIRHLLFFFRQLAILLGGGMSLSEALRSLGSRTKGRLGAIVADARDRVSAGDTLFNALCRYPHVFNRLILSLVRAGEMGGLLMPMVERIAAYLEYEIGIRRKIALAIFYPAIVVILLVPASQLEALMQGGGEAYFAALKQWFITWVPRLLLAAVLVKLLFQFSCVKKAWDAFKLMIPIIGPTARRIAMLRFSRVLASLYGAGLPLTEAVSVSSDACANLALGARISRAISALRSGIGLTQALQRTGAFAPIVLDMLLTGEKTGRIDDTLNTVADYMEGEVDASLQKLAIALFVVALLVVSILVILLLVRFYTSYFNKVMGGI